jgi:hypothetical protein
MDGDSVFVAAATEIESPADKATRLLGVKAIAKACGLTAWAVYRWRYTLRGHIPAGYQPTVYYLARRVGAPISAEDIIGVIPIDPEPWPPVFLGV